MGYLYLYLLPVPVPVFEIVVMFLLKTAKVRVINATLLKLECNQLGE